MTLELVPLTFEQAAAFVDAHHRNHRRPTGHKWSTGVIADGVLVGVSMVGRPVARNLDAASAMGYRRLVTYTEAGESGASLRACGWRIVAELPPRSGWWTPSRPRTDHGRDNIARTLWDVA
jgi:hypothetical protein